MWMVRDLRTNIEPRLSKNGRKNYLLVMPSGYDLESEFINPEHIHSCANQFLWSKLIF